MWLKKRRERSAEEALDAVQPVESLRRAAEEGGLHVPQLRLSIPLGEGGQAPSARTYTCELSQLRPARSFYKMVL
jgi:hypothetical protein